MLPSGQWALKRSAVAAAYIGGVSLLTAPHLIFCTRCSRFAGVEDVAPSVRAVRVEEKTAERDRLRAELEQVGHGSDCLPLYAFRTL